MRITVTRHDIDNGRPSDPHLCPIALAVARAYAPGPHPTVYVTVYPDSIEVDGPNRVDHYPGTPATADFIDLFDNASPAERAALQPISVDLGDPTPI